MDATSLKTKGIAGIESCPHIKRSASRSDAVVEAARPARLAPKVTRVNAVERGFRTGVRLPSSPPSLLFLAGMSRVSTESADYSFAPGAVAYVTGHGKTQLLPSRVSVRRWPRSCRSRLAPWTLFRWLLNRRPGLAASLATESRHTFGTNIKFGPMARCCMMQLTGRGLMIRAGQTLYLQISGMKAP